MVCLLDRRHRRRYLVCVLAARRGITLHVYQVWPLSERLFFSSYLRKFGCVVHSCGVQFVCEFVKLQFVEVGIHLVGKIKEVQNKGRSWCRRLLLVCAFTIGVFVQLQFDISAIRFLLNQPDRLTLITELPNHFPFYVV